MTDERTKFDYLLNAYDEASRHANPASQQYAEKRKALFEYVRGLERIALARGSADERLSRLEQRVGVLESLPSVEDELHAFGS